MITNKDSLNWLNLQLIECIDALIQSVRQQTPSTDKILVAAFYTFVDWNDFKDLKLRLESVCEKAGTLGTILLASEGINGTIEGRKSNVNSCIKYIKDRFSMRQKQTLIARKSNKSHIYQKEY